MVPLVNILLSLRPLWRKKDDLSDIPLTPAQRQLLGLPPSPAAATPNAAYSTPPRYSRTPSISGSVGSRASYASSPLSGRGSPAVGLNGGSPYSPAGSPLVQKALGNGMNGNRRTSLGSPAAIGNSTGTSLFSDPATPSPSAGKRASVGLNSKWLYERGRRTSGTWLQ
jgi:nucleoporin POM34